MGSTCGGNLQVRNKDHKTIQHENEKFLSSEGREGSN